MNLEGRDGEKKISCLGSRLNFREQIRANYSDITWDYNLKGRKMGA